MTTEIKAETNRNINIFYFINLQKRNVLVTNVSYYLYFLLIEDDWSNDHNRIHMFVFDACLNTLYYW